MRYVQSPFLDQILIKTAYVTYVISHLKKPWSCSVDFGIFLLSSNFYCYSPMPIIVSKSVTWISPIINTKCVCDGFPHLIKICLQSVFVNILILPLTLLCDTTGPQLTYLWLYSLSGQLVC